MACEGARGSFPNWVLAISSGVPTGVSSSAGSCPLSDHSCTTTIAADDQLKTFGRHGLQKRGGRRGETYLPLLKTTSPDCADKVDVRAQQLSPEPDQHLQRAHMYFH